jgi:transposase
METAMDYKVLYEEQKAINEQLNFSMASLQHQVKELQRLLYGSRHERFMAANNNSSQLSLDIQAEEVAAVKITGAQKIEYTRVKKQVTNKEHPGRYKLPEHLERREKIIEPKETTEGLKRIGEEITEELDYEPGKLFVNKIIRPKYAKPNSEGVIIAPMIERPLPKAIAGAGLLAQIVIDKYVDHLPLYRQMERMKREGVNFPYSTLTDCVSGTCALIRPLYEAHKKIILRSNYLHADETPLKVLDRNKKGETHKGYYWVYHNSIEGLVLFEYQPGRGREGPQEMLKDFKGHLQTDGYCAYDLFKDKEGITLLRCMAHARRKFFEAKENDKARAEYALEQIALLYAIERKAKEQHLTGQQIMQLRQNEAVPVLKKLGEWMKEQYIEVLPKSPIGKALGYSIERWEELMIYTTDGKLNIDNNPVENSIRPVAIGRKNYLFAGSHEAAQRSAMLYSLLSTCRLHGINPFIWLRDVLQRIAVHPINKIEELLPQNWQTDNNSYAKLTEEQISEAV